MGTSTTTVGRAGTLPGDDESFYRGRGRVLLWIIDAAAVAVGTGPLLSLLSDGIKHTSGTTTPLAGWRLALTLAATAGIIALTIHHQRVILGRGWRIPVPVSLGVLFALTYPLVPVLGETWLIPPAFLLLGLVAALPWRRAWPPALAVVVAEPLLAIPFDDGVGLALFRTLQIVITSALLYGLARAVALAEELARARQELAELAVVRERLRVARDLHDSLGQSLTAIALQAELAQRWAAKGDLARVSQHAEQVLELARSTGAEMRGLVTSYRTLSLQEEVRAAASLLGDRGITCQVDVAVAAAGLSEDGEQALAWSLREAATNVVRHSDARRCRIALVADPAGVSLVVGNDGARRAGAEQPGSAGPGGNGLLGIADRALSQGGWSQSKLGMDGWFELTVFLPESAEDRTARALASQDQP